jgi:hypothetical protein
MSAYHPGLRRFVSSSGRTGIAYLLAIQDGLQHIIHTLSPAGALTDLGRGDVPGGMPAIGHDLKPGLVAQQTLNGPWAPEWASRIVDEKPLPYRMTTAYKMWGNYAKTPLWRKSYLGRHYGLACLDVAVGNETVPVMAQWRRVKRPVATMRELGTLIMRHGINRTELLDSIWHGTKNRNPNGSVGTQGGHIVAVQHDSRAIVLTSPYADLKYPGGRPVPPAVTSLQTTVGLFSFEQAPSWAIYVDDEKVRTLPHRAGFRQRVTIKDGVSYVGLIPLPATDLGRDAEVVISADGVLTDMQGGGKAKEALRIDAYNFRSDTPLDKRMLGSRKLDQAHGGFVVEMGDVEEHGSFDAFRRHVKDAKLLTRWEAKTATLHVAYRSGKDVIELGYRPGYGGDWHRKVPTDQVFPYRRVNGRWPYLPPTMDRDTTLTQQGRTGRLQKNGAVLVTEPGKMSYLQTEPSSGTYAGFNPFPDPVSWTMTVPGGVRVSADGKLGLARVVVRPGENRLWVDHAFRAEHEGAPGTATCLLVSGLKARPRVVLNGRPLQKLGLRGAAYVVPLSRAARAR